MYGVFKPGGPVARLPLDLDTVFQAPSVALFRKPGAPSAKLSRRDGLVLHVFGEIYNAQEVCPVQCDPGDELASLHELLRSPDWFDLLAKLNGSFLIVAYDERADRLRLISDRFASRVCFYAWRDGVFHFFSHLHYFLKLGFRSEIDLDFLVQYLTFKWIIGKKTTVEGAFRVPPGSVLEIGADGVQSRRYWAWCYDESRDDLDDPAEAARELGERLLKAVERRLRGKGRVLVPLSGGLDSRGILGAVLECIPADRILAFTYGTPGSLDYEIGRLVAQSAGVPHRALDLSAPHDYQAEFLRRTLETDGMVDQIRNYPSDYEPLLDFSRDALVGFMGDMLLGHCLPEDPEAERPADEIAALRPALRLRRYVAAETVSRLVGKDLEECDRIVMRLMAEGNEGNDHRLAGNYMLRWDFPNRQCKFVIEQTFLLRELFNYLPPYIDRDFVDFALAVPIPWRQNQRLYKSMLITRFPKLFALPTRNCDGLPLTAGPWSRLRRKLTKLAAKGARKWPLNALPAARALTNTEFRRQVLFHDDQSLLRTPTPFQVLYASKLKSLVGRGILDGHTILRLWSEQISGQAAHMKVLAILVSLEFVLEAFVDRQGHAEARVEDVTRDA